MPGGAIPGGKFMPGGAMPGGGPTGGGGITSGLDPPEAAVGGPCPSMPCPSILFPSRVIAALYRCVTALQQASMMRGDALAARLLYGLASNRKQVQAPAASFAVIMVGMDGRSERRPDRRTESSESRSRVSRGVSRVKEVHTQHRESAVACLNPSTCTWYR